MGASLEVLKTCDGTCGQGKSDSSRGRNSDQPCRGHYNFDDDASCGCTAVEDGIKHAVATVRRGGARISDEVLLNHELLQHARQGNVKGLNEALEKGAWTETRRPLVMKPQKPEATNSKGGQNSCGGPYDKGDPGEVGMTALMFAAQNGSAECVRRLIWASADVNAIEEDGWSALHFAAKEGHFTVCTTLLQSKANPELINSEDRTPLQVAAEEDDEFADKFKKAIQKSSDTQCSTEKSTL